MLVSRSRENYYCFPMQSYTINSPLTLIDFERCNSFLDTIFLLKKGLPLMCQYKSERIRYFPPFGGCYFLGITWQQINIYIKLQHY